MQCPNCGKPLSLEVTWKYIDEIEPDSDTPDTFDITASRSDVEEYINFEHIVEYGMWCGPSGCGTQFNVTDYEEITDDNGEMTVVIKGIKEAA